MAATEDAAPQNFDLPRFLRDIHDDVARHEDTLRQNGYTQLILFQTATIQDLKDCGLPIAHARAILSAVSTAIKQMTPDERHVATTYVLEVDGREFPLNRDDFFRHGSHYLINICEKKGVRFPHHFVWKDVHGRELLVDGIVSESTRALMELTPRVLLTDKSAIESYARLSASVSKILDETLERGGGAWDMMKSYKDDGILREVEIGELLGFCGIDGLIETSPRTVDLLIELERCTDDDEPTMQTRLNEFFTSDNFRSCLIGHSTREVPMSSTQLPTGTKHYHTELGKKRTDFLAMLERVEGVPATATDDVSMHENEDASMRMDEDDDEKKSDEELTEDERLFGVREVVDTHTGRGRKDKDKPDLIVRNDEGHELFIIELMAESNGGVAFHQKQLHKFLLRLLRKQKNRRAFAIGILIRGWSRYQLMVVTRRNVQILMTEGIHSYSTRASLFHVLLTLVSRKLPDLNFGLMPLQVRMESNEIGRRATPVVVKRYLRTGGESFVFLGNANGDVVVVKFVKRSESLERLKVLYDPLSNVAIVVLPIGECSFPCLIYPQLRTASIDHVTAQDARAWERFASGLWQFHELEVEFKDKQSGKLAHLDINPSNILVQYGELVVNDLGSCERRGSRVKPFSTRPFFDSEWLDENGMVMVTKEIDYLMLFRSMEWFCCSVDDRVLLSSGRRAFGVDSIGQPNGVRSLEDLCRRVASVFEALPKFF